MTKILFICHGNICRSTMAQSVMTHLVNKENMKDIFIDSAATSREEIGSPVYYATADKLKEKNIKVIEHRARQMTKEDYLEFDYLIAMDMANIRNINKILALDESKKDKKIYRLKEFINSYEDIADPWYTRDFEKTFNDIYASCKALLQYLKTNKKNL